VAEIRRDTGIVDDVLAVQARDIWTRFADLLALNHRDAFTFSHKGPLGDS
jgi:hypothetical protein